ncbi:lysoplasmalogenase [Pedobacter yulinensis]|uniref:Lysoplasmalogenase n=1 Tax=Pedobacter yulinensis TaxID=2126353 RepID=A0A2T3HKM7_9SPHI|nr:lysoplasmalogenase [Pedobacter yulinensis]PST82941.1 lysoplasmalogenase [Pedobacter yulinensis]
MSRTKLFNILYLLTGMAQLVAIWTGNHSLRACTKPLIVVLLLVWLVVETGLKGRFQKVMLLGLLAALAGDILLLFPGDPFFLAGLSAFLICHLCYIRAFRLDYLSDPSQPNPYFMPALASFGILCAALMIFLNAYLGNMRLPVLAYAFVISWMGVMAVNRYGRVNAGSFRLGLAGAVLFVASDALLAIQKFAHPFPSAELPIMGAYMLAQYLLVNGAMVRRLKVTRTPID